MDQPSLILGEGLGSGAHGKVFRAHFKGQPCVAKQVYFSESSLVLTSLEDEVRKIEQLRNKHLIQLFGAVWNNDAFTIIMDHAEGGSLERAILTRGRLTDWSQKARIAQEIVRGLDFLHDMDILHCDLKSANVLLTKRMEVKLCDFGLATMVRTDSFSASEVTRASGRIAGQGSDARGKELKSTSVRWMAPELLIDGPVFSTKSDMYALAMVMWEMAANKTPPFKELRDPAVVIERVCDGTREMLPEDVPHDYQHWLEQCWDQDPAERPEAREMVNREDAPRLSRTASVSDISSMNATKFFGLTQGPGLKGRAIKMAGLEGSDLRIIPPDSARTSQSSFQTLSPVSPTWSTTSSSLFSPRVLSSRPSTHTSEAPSEQPVQHQRQFKDLAECLQHAEQDNPYAQYVLATHIENGPDIHGREAQAFNWYHRAAKLGHVEAQHRIGAICLAGRDDVQPNYREAARWLRKAAKKGHAPAQNDLGVMFQRSIIAPKDSSSGSSAGEASGLTVQQQASKMAQKEGFKWILQAAVKGCATAQCNLAWYPLHGKQVEQSDKEAVVWLRKAADQGEDAAMNYLGWMYLNGRGVPQNDSLAFNWFLKAAMMGSADGQCNLGWMHMHGRGTPQNFSEAVVWLRKAVEPRGEEDGLAPAYYNLGWLYLRGDGVDQASSSNALKLFRKAAKQGHADAQYCVGWMYARGDGVTRQNYEKAAVWLHRSADQGCLQAQHCLGWMYREGQITIPSTTATTTMTPTTPTATTGMTRTNSTSRKSSNAMAVKWFRKAAEQGYAPSQICLAKMYRSGNGVAQDMNQARAWLKMAADQGSSYAIQKLEAIDSMA